MSFWDDEEMQAPPEPLFVKLDKVGDGFSGTIVSVRKVKFEDDGQVTWRPQIEFIDDATGEMRTWTVGQTDAKRKCAELRPWDRDHITVRFTGTSGKFKHIDMTVDNRPEMIGFEQPAQPAVKAASVVNLPTYQAADPPVYATNGNGNGNGLTAPPAEEWPVRPAIGDPPAGIAPELWARMSPEQRAALAAVPAF